MAIRKLRYDEDPCLYKMCREVTKFDDRLGELIDDMFETMEDANGVGLAGPQVGVLRRVIVLHADKRKIELVNPRIIASSGLQRGYEGCLSFPEQSGYVERPDFVVVEGFNRKGEAVTYSGSALFARAVFHECDHLDGRVYLTLVTDPPEDFIDGGDDLPDVDDEDAYEDEDA